MKVAFLKSRLNYRGGLEKYTLALAQSFQEKGDCVSLLTTDPMPGAINLGRSSKLSIYHHLHFDQLCSRWLKEHPQDIVFGMERNRHQTHYRAGSGVHACYLKQRMEIEPFSKRLSLRLNPLHHFLLKREKEAFEDPNLKVLFTNSHMVRQQILETYAVDPQKIQVVHNGVEWHAFEKPFQKRKPDSPFTFLFVGNDYHRKGLRYLLEALPKECQLLVVGKEKDESYFRQIASKQVTFYGPQKDLIPFYRRAHALVIPSLYDPFSNVTLEAMAMGLFVVSSKFNGGHEILTPQTGAVIEDLFSKESVVQSLEKAFDSQGAKEIREHVKQLDFSNQLAKIVEIVYKSQ